MSDHDLLRRARMALVQDAEVSRTEMSALDWSEKALASEVGQLVGEREIEVIVRLVFGIGCRPLKLSIRK